METAAHQHHFAHPFCDARFHAQCQRDVRQRSGGNQRDRAWFRLHDGLHDEIHRMHVFERTGGHGQFDTVQPCFTMDRFSHFLLAHERTIGTCVYGNIMSMRCFEHCTRIIGNLLEALIPPDRGDCHDLDLWISQC